MQITRTAALLAFSASAVFAEIVKDAPNPLSDRAAIPVVYVGKASANVAAFHFGDPRAEINGQRETVSGGVVSLVPGGNFDPGFVNFSSSTASANYVRGIAGTLNAEAPTFNGTFVSDCDLDDAYILLLAFEAMTGDYSQRPNVAVVGYEIGTLKKGRAKSMEVALPRLKAYKPLQWTALIFRGRHQLHTSLGNRTLDALFDSVERASQHSIIAGRTTGDLPPMICRMFPLSFDPLLKQIYAGRTLRMRVRVSSAGFFESVSMSDSQDPVLLQSVANQMGAWLFLPRVKNGLPQATDMILPIQF